MIPFPNQAQLLDGLSTFDAVIFEDFSFNRFGIGAQGMDAAIRRFVEGGGGFLLLGQGDAFGPNSPYRGVSPGAAHSLSGSTRRPRRGLLCSAPRRSRPDAR